VPIEPELRTSRLILRRWRDADRAPFAALNADPIAMEHFPAPLRRHESDDLAARIAVGLEERGWGLWAVEIPGTATFAGFVGLNPATFDAPFTPAVEVGWRLAREQWGRGYATEGARAALAVGFDELALDEIVSFTTHGNARSRRVMERLGMARDPADDFDNPNVPDGDPLRPHVLYRLDRATWRRGAARAR
jgi:RimJ/RimL family protein N-acetyltransferase